MRIVLGHTNFVVTGGTETYMLTVAQELLALGHDVTIYGAEELGQAAADARSAGIPVAGAFDELPQNCEATLANDSSTAFELAARYPGAAHTMVVHSSFFQLQSPPQLEGVCDRLIVLNDRIRAHVESLAFHAPITRLTQPVDTLRFGPQGEDPQVARSALVLGNYMTGANAKYVSEACTSAGIEPVFAGLQSDFAAEPERAIAAADLVIGLGRCIVEAMSGRRAAYVFGIAGGDGWVTEESYRQLEADGFAGGGTDEAISFDRLARDLADWSPKMGAVNRQIALAKHDAADHARALVAVFHSINPGSSAISLDAAGENARLIRAEWRMWNNWSRSVTENRKLQAALDAERRAHHALTETRRHKLASLLLAPLDLLKKLLRR
ncbi:MAG: hypothetical protein JHD02_06390 [Thermoleophilaceae bacterium]|nr:hypothetical protein [Thermoleophilaceae bacterium]